MAGKRKKKLEFLNRDVVIRKINHRRRVHGIESPLTRLKEIFETSPDKDRFVGDTMFWKYFEDIDCERVKDTTSVEFRNLWIMFHETLAYVIFLLIFTAYCYMVQSPVLYEFRQEQMQYWSGCDAAGGNCRLRDVHSVSSFWDWMQQDLIPMAFTEYEDGYPIVASIRTEFSLPESIEDMLCPPDEEDRWADDGRTNCPLDVFPLTFSPRFVGSQMTNVLLGTVRIRQLRVQRNHDACRVSKLFGHIYPDCYSAFSEEHQSKEYYAQDFAPSYLSPAFTFTEADETRQIWQSGSLGDYPGGGFVCDLPANHTDSDIMMQDLRDWSWWDQSTRAVQIEINVLNTNINAIANNRILFEFGPTGSVLSTHQVNSAMVWFLTPSVSSLPAAGLMIMQLLIFFAFQMFVAFIGWQMYRTCKNFLGENVWSFLKNSESQVISNVLFRTLYHYCEYGWNMMDLLICFAFNIHLLYRLITFGTVAFEDNLASDVIGHPEKFMPFSRALAPHEYGFFTLSFLAMLMWIKLFKYLCIISYFRVLVRILEKCARALLRFSLLLLVVFFGFAVAFFVGFGATEENYSTLPGSFLILFFKLIDGYPIDSRWFEPGRLQIMPVVFFCYISIVYFVLLNVFLAVVLDVYATSKSTLSAEQSEKKNQENPMWVFLDAHIHWQTAGIAVKDRSNEDNSSQERSDFLSIRLELLPGIVQRKWIEKKRKLQMIANENFANLEVFPPGEAPAIGGEGDKKKKGDWMLPSSKVTLTKMQAPVGEKPPSFYTVPNSTVDQEVSREQLQRLMDEDESLPIMLGSSDAVKVIKDFKKRALDEQDRLALDDATKSQFGLRSLGDVSLVKHEMHKKEMRFREDAVKALQGEVFAKLDKQEKMEPDLVRKPVPKVEEMTNEMSQSLTEVRNQFRHQLTGIIEAIASLFEHLVELTQGVDKVRANHKNVAHMLKDQLALEKSMTPAT